MGITTHKLVFEFESHFAYHSVLQAFTRLIKLETFHASRNNRVDYEKLHIGYIGQSSLSVSNRLLSYCEYYADTYD